MVTVMGNDPDMAMSPDRVFIWNEDELSWSNTGSLCVYRENECDIQLHTAKHP